MQRDKRTLSDLRHMLKMRTASHEIGLRKLRFLGHIARKGPASLECQCLFAWLYPEHQQAALHRGHQLRNQYSKLLEEIRQLTEHSAENWPAKWLILACEADGATWHQLISKWSKTQHQLDLRDTWAARHAPGGPADRRAALAQERARLAHGALPAPGGKYACPHCDEHMLLRSLRLRISPCGRLPPAQRQLLAARRAQRRARKGGQAAPDGPGPEDGPAVPVPLVQAAAADPAPAGRRRRVNRLRADCEASNLRLDLIPFGKSVPRNSPLQ